MEGRKEAAPIHLALELQSEDSEETKPEIEVVAHEGDLLFSFGQTPNVENASSEYSSTSSSETDRDHGGQLGLSLQSLSSSAVSSIQQGHFNQMELVEKKLQDSLRENQALRAELGRKNYITRKKERESESRLLSLEYTRKSQSTEYKCISDAISSCANKWEATGARPKATSVGRQPNGKGMRSGEGPSVGLSLHRASYGDHMNDMIESHQLKPYEVDDWKISSCSFDEGLQTTMAGLPQETPGINLQFLMRHSEDQSFLGSATAPARAPPEGIYVWTSPQGAVPRGPSMLDSDLMAVHPQYRSCELEQSQTTMAGMPQETTGIGFEFLVKHSEDWSFLECSSASDEHERGPPEGRGQNEGTVQKKPSEQEEREGFLPLRLERDRVARRWCFCNRITNNTDLGPICEFCVRHLYCGPGSLSHTNQHHICCYCLEDGVGEFLSLSCNHKFHKDCIIAAILFNLLNCPICGQVFMRLA